MKKFKCGLYYGVMILLFLVVEPVIGYLRFSDKEIRSTYYVNNPSIVVVSMDSYLNIINPLKDIKQDTINAAQMQFKICVYAHKKRPKCYLKALNSP